MDRKPLSLSERDAAFDDEQFRVYLQPKYSLMDDKPCGAEALARWANPERGTLLPQDFLPEFEQNGFMEQLDHYIWEHVCQLIRKWLQTGERVDPISVNLSQTSLCNPKTVDVLVSLTERYQVPHRLLNLEVTEKAYLADPLTASAVIGQLRNYGFSVILDDFGSGYSSLNILKDLDVDILKIDMRCLPSGEHNVKSEKILASIARMADWLGMPVVVEGVETREQKDFLVSIGCGYVQGYYFAKPMPVDSYQKFVRSWNGGQAQYKEPEAVSQDKLDAIWSADVRNSELLKSVSVPFAVLEYSNNGVEILRMNEEYHRVFGDGTDHLELLNLSERSKLYLALDEAMGISGEGNCDCMYVLPGGVNKWYRVHLQTICRIADGVLFGTTFLDITTERSQELELQHVLNALRMPDNRLAHMLIIDDAEVSLEILCQLFEGEYQILQATNGEEGLEQLKAHSDTIAIILLDMIMPVMSGQEFLARKNQMEEAADIPVVVISTDNSETMQINMLQSGVNDYITKPFVPQTVLRRVKNVMEYSSRFRTLLKEYNDALLVKSTRQELMMKERFSVANIKGILGFLKYMFDIVRVVNPEEMKVLEFQDDGTVKYQAYSCYQVWGRSGRCENCSSQCAMKRDCMLSKFETIEDDVFYVISQPIHVVLADQRTISCVMEVVSHISEHINEPETQMRSVEDVLEMTRKKIYLDPLTEAYNRRYYDEMKFLKGQTLREPIKLGLILMDMRHFKQANDLYGHMEGDRILAGVSKELRSQVRAEDSVIRYGGDEFVVIMTGCEADQMPGTIERLRSAVSNVHYGTGKQVAAEADFGYVHTDSFDGNIVRLQKLFNQADQNMYEAKRGHEAPEQGGK